MCNWRVSVDDTRGCHWTRSQTEPNQYSRSYKGPAAKRWTLREVSMNWATQQPMNPSVERTRAECCPGPEMRDRPRMIDPRSHRARYSRHRVVLARIRALLD